MQYRRVSLLFKLFSLLLVLVVVRLFWLQVVDAPHLTAMARRQQEKTFPAEQYTRGDILDRQGRSLTGTDWRQAAVVFPNIISNPENLARQLEQALGWNAIAIQQALSDRKKYSLVLKSGLTDAEAAYLRSAAEPGIQVYRLMTRNSGEAVAPHLVGYLGVIDDRTWTSLRQQGLTREQGGTYSQDDLIGIKGIEALYERYLRDNQFRYLLNVATDARGRPLGEPQAQVVQGTTRQNVILTLDYDLQRAVEGILERRKIKGAVVVLDTASGDVLAMASAPGFDPARPDSARDAEGAYLNKALQYYYPGSVFKVLVAAAALDFQLVAPDERFFCPGYYQLPGGTTIPCWLDGGHGELTFAEALAVSCNVTFITVGLRVGRQGLTEYAQHWGLTEPDLTGYPLPAGAQVNIDYGPGKLANAALGQEGVRLSPLQVAEMMATIARGGLALTPRLVLRTENEQGAAVYAWERGTTREVVSPAVAQQLQVMLAAVTQQGTGRQAWIPGVGTAGKTGSAQTGRVDLKGQELLDTWFAGWLPLDQPRYAVAVLVEGGQSGGSDAAPVFREIASWLLSGQ